MKKLHLLLLTALSLSAAQIEQVDWATSPKFFGRKTVQVELGNGVVVEGRWIAVQNDLVTMKISQSSDPSVVASGMQIWTRSSIVAVRRRHKHIRGRLLGTLNGLYGSLGAAVVMVQSPQGLQSPYAAAVLVHGISGYCNGRALDRAWHAVELVN